MGTEECLWKKQKNLVIQAIKLNFSNPYSNNTAVEEPKLSESVSPECRKFEVRCHAGDAGHLKVASSSVSVRIGQRIRRDVSPPARVY